MVAFVWALVASTATPALATGEFGALTQERETQWKILEQQEVVERLERQFEKQVAGQTSLGTKPATFPGLPALRRVRVNLSKGTAGTSDIGFRG